MDNIGIAFTPSHLKPMTLSPEIEKALQGTIEYLSQTSVDANGEIGFRKMARECILNHLGTYLSTPTEPTPEPHTFTRDNKKFSLLQAEHNGVDIFSGDHVDKNGKTGIPGLTYFTGEAAMRECKKQGKQLLKTGNEVDAFINSFPGLDKERKIKHLVKEFNLPRSGFWDPGSAEWVIVGSVGYAALSEVLEDGLIREAKWLDADAFLLWDFQKYPQPVLVFEDCSPIGHFEPIKEITKFKIIDYCPTKIEADLYHKQNDIIDSHNKIIRFINKK